MGTTFDAETKTKIANVFIEQSGDRFVLRCQTILVDGVVRFGYTNITKVASSEKLPLPEQVVKERQR